MAVIVAGTPTSFHRTPINTTLYIDGRKTYYTANMENVDGVLDVPHGGTGSNTFTDGEVVVYSDGKFISAGITKKELSTLSGLSPSEGTGDGETPAKTIVELLNEKVSVIALPDGTPLDMADDGKVRIPDYLLKTGGTISGNLQVNGGFAVGNVMIAHDPITDCITFKRYE